MSDAYEHHALVCMAAVLMYCLISHPEHRWKKQRATPSTTSTVIMNNMKPREVSETEKSWAGGNVPKEGFKAPTQRPQNVHTGRQGGWFSRAGYGNDPVPPPRKHDDDMGAMGGGAMPPPDIMAGLGGAGGPGGMPGGGASAGSASGTSGGSAGGGSVGGIQRGSSIMKGLRDTETANSQADRMRNMFMASTQQHTYRRQIPLNPIWMNFPQRCSVPIQSEQEMRALLRHHASSDDVMLVRYWQDGCTACNALEKVYEWLCHETRKSFPKLRFYDVQQEKNPSLVKGLVRYPQIKGFSNGQWVDIDFKPPEEHREMQYQAVQQEVKAAQDRGAPLSAVQAEEMYFSATGPAMATVTEENITAFYNAAQARMHNYWKQVSERRAWFFKKFLARTEQDLLRAKESESASLFGEQTITAIHVPNTAPAPGATAGDTAPLSPHTNASIAAAAAVASAKAMATA